MLFISCENDYRADVRLIDADIIVVKQATRMLFISCENDYRADVRLIDADIIVVKQATTPPP